MQYFLELATKSTRFLHSMKTYFQSYTLNRVAPVSKVTDQRKIFFSLFQDSDSQTYTFTFALELEFWE